VFMQISGSEMIAHWVYSTELFERTTILRMASHFEKLLRHAVTEPETRLTALQMLSDEEKQQREKERTERKQSRRSKLMSSAPKAVDLASVSSDEDN